MWFWGVQVRTAQAKGLVSACVHFADAHGLMVRREAPIDRRAQPSAQYTYQDQNHYPSGGSQAGSCDAGCLKLVLTPLKLDSASPGRAFVPLERLINA